MNFQQTRLNLLEWYCTLTIEVWLKSNILIADIRKYEMHIYISLYCMLEMEMNVNTLQLFFSEYSIDDSMYVGFNCLEANEQFIDYVSSLFGVS